MRNLPPLSALRAFEAIARHGSVTRAAGELHRTHGAVSRQLRLLQEHVGAPLFDKAGTGLQLNDAGRALYDLARRSFDELESGYARVLRQARDPGLHVACSATFAMRWLVPNLERFYRACPDVRLRLSMTSARQMRSEDADLLIAWDLSAYPPADRERAIKLAGVAFGPVHAPGYKPARGQRVRIAHDYTGRAWEQWQTHDKRPLSFARELTFPHTHLCIEAAMAGLGVALVERRLVRRELEEGTLVAPRGFVAFDDGMMALPAQGRPMSREGQALVDWLRTALGPETDLQDS
ncbi:MULTISPECIES: LysR substrate-binding domain-containing protein [unclassified Achromobacter]|uniref:LysR substrate-binding domain-containing protein n=1 Tax=unclassified Achromobacter TaxID=2626865 RepID=UPI000B51C63B|nr:MULTISPECIES: LysR substrate-binding domain-containing protein [unclassified Achromobacter]OWT80499.1 LysR family transcriptional regulator [Achromobacter sp. HZ34]OWT82382.1 LysR family transcriptional regulator [Achromobacter sp. HZ28]